MIERARHTEGMSGRGDLQHTTEHPSKFEHFERVKAAEAAGTARDAVQAKREAFDRLMAKQKLKLERMRREVGERRNDRSSAEVRDPRGETHLHEHVERRDEGGVEQHKHEPMDSVDSIDHKKPESELSFGSKPSESAINAQKVKTEGARKTAESSSVRAEQSKKSFESMVKAGNLEQAKTERIVMETRINVAKKDQEYFENQVKKLDSMMKDAKSS